MTAKIQTYTVAEAAEILHVTRRTLSRLVQRKLLRKTKVGGRTLFRASEIERCLERGTRGRGA